jgi:hypothetical protein
MADQNPPPPTTSDQSAGQAQAEASFINALKRNATTLKPHHAGRSKPTQHSSLSTDSTEDKEGRENETPSSRNRSDSAVTSSRKVKKSPSLEGTASASVNGDKKTPTPSASHQAPIEKGTNRKIPLASKTKKADKAPVSASMNTCKNKTVSSNVGKVAWDTLTAIEPSPKDGHKSVEGMSRSAIPSIRSAATIRPSEESSLHYETPSKSVAQEQDACEKAVHERAARKQAIREQLARDQSAPTHKASFNKSEPSVEGVSRSAIPPKKSATTIRPSVESSFHYETPSKSVAQEQDAREKSVHERAARKQAAPRDQAAPAGKASITVGISTQWKVRAFIPVVRAWRTVSNRNIGNPDRGEFGENGLLVVMEEPIWAIRRQVWYQDRFGTKLFSTDVDKSNPWSMIQGNAGVEPCLFMDTVNNEQQRLRRFFFRFSSNFVLASALGHILYDNMDLLDEFFNSNGTNRFLTTSNSLPDHAIVHADDDMVIDSVPVRPSNTPARYKVESQYY